MEGFRKSLMEEFSDIYVFNLRGNQRTSGELSRKEGGKIFGSGSRTPVAITVLVKKPSKPAASTIHYCDIGDYLTREQKLGIVDAAHGIEGTPWTDVTPNERGDWINQRGGKFDTMNPLCTRGSVEDNSLCFMRLHCTGVSTNRDAWVYNFSRNTLIENIKITVAFYNSQVERYANLKEKPDPKSFVEVDNTKISWSRGLINSLKREQLYEGRIDSQFRIVCYRPFCKELLFFDRIFNEGHSQIPSMFPTPNTHNLFICTNGTGVPKDFSIFITNEIPDIQLMANGWYFPLYYYEPASSQGLLASEGEEVVDGYVRRDAITDAMLSECQKRYGAEITKEDIFFYVYGALHSPKYREEYANELKKELARLPLPARAETFLAISGIGRNLADIHVNYETGRSTIRDRKGRKHNELESYPLDIKFKGAEGVPDEVLYRVGERKMKLGTYEEKQEDGTKRKRFDGTLKFNDRITFAGIPQEAFQYVVNGRSPLEWLVERYYVRTDKASGIVDDPNLWSEDPKYVFKLVGRLVRVAVETVKLTATLPDLE